MTLLLAILFLLVSCGSNPDNPVPKPPAPPEKVFEINAKYLKGWATVKGDKVIEAKAVTKLAVKNLEP